MSTKPVLIQKKDKVAAIVLNRPKVMNAMSKEMIEQLHAAVHQIASDENFKIVAPITPERVLLSLYSKTKKPVAVSN